MLGSSIDIQVAQLAIGYEGHILKQQEDKASGKISSDMSQEQMQAMIDQVKNRVNKQSSK